MSFNRLELSAELAKIAELRYTPAGIPVLSFHLLHVSEQVEAKMKRRVECDVPSMVMGQLALETQTIAEGTQVNVTGFLAKRSLKSAQLVLHIQTLEKII
ncbi:primosomal replication protein N [Methylobacillus gramineus]|uniref:primosomal replication protein N n=1 Tax=Methylobacillus gramineus TaxID=755169 RepID=UPI001D00015E|nr:primosomal replication protein N [Methylobacillus gramineus]MCB5184243.1 primosomal replication protein N [Methylobacillus gramineus]